MRPVVQGRGPAPLDFHISGLPVEGLESGQAIIHGPSEVVEEAREGGRAWVGIRGYRS